MKDQNAVKLGRKGGRSTKKKYGQEHYKKIGKLGGRPKKKVSSP